MSTPTTPWLERQLCAFATKARRGKADRPKTHPEQEQDLKSLAIIAREIDPAASEATFWSWIDQITSLPDVDAELVDEEAETAWQSTKDAEVFVPLTVVPTRQQRKYTLNSTLDYSLDTTQQPSHIPVVPEVVVASVKTQRTQAALLNLAREHGLPYSAISVTTRTVARALRELNGDRGYVDPLGQPDQSTAAKHLAQAIEDGVVVQLVPGRPHDADTGTGGICGIYGLRGSGMTAEQVLERGRATFVYRQRMTVDDKKAARPNPPVITAAPPIAKPAPHRPLEKYAVVPPGPAFVWPTGTGKPLDLLAEFEREMGYLPTPAGSKPVLVDDLPAVPTSCEPQPIVNVDTPADGMTRKQYRARVAGEHETVETQAPMAASLPAARPKRQFAEPANVRLTRVAHLYLDRIPEALAQFPDAVLALRVEAHLARHGDDSFHIFGSELMDEVLSLPALVR